MKRNLYVAAIILPILFTYGRDGVSETTSHTNIKRTISNKILNLTTFTNKAIYDLHGKIAMKILLSNTSDKPIYIFDNLALGESASLSIWAIDVNSGHAVGQTRMFDALPPPPNSKNRFIKLNSNYIYGVTYNFDCEDLGITKKGKYKLIVEYHSPIPSGYSFGLPTWTREMGKITATPVTITVE